MGGEVILAKTTIKNRKIVKEQDFKRGST